MIATEKFNEQDLITIDFENKLRKIYSNAGIPKKYHFCTLEKDWSKSYSPLGTLSGIAKKRSELAYKFIKSYIESLPGIMNGNGLKIIYKKNPIFVTDLILDGSRSSGKTFLLSVIAQEAIKLGYSAKYVEWPEYIDRFQSFDTRNLNEEFYEDCLDCDLLIFDSLYEYDINNSKFFNVQLDRLISSRLNKEKVTICSIDTLKNQNPAFGFIWNKFSRETFTFKLPEAALINENNTKKSGTKNS